MSELAPVYMCIAVVLAYLTVKLAGQAFVRSRCCGAKVRYQLGWSYKTDGYACAKCGMLQD